jgi:hypothetical protein
MFDCSTQRDVTKLGINHYCIQTIQDLKDVNEEKGLSVMRYFEVKSVQN